MGRHGMELLAGVRQRDQIADPLAVGPPDRPTASLSQPALAGAVRPDDEDAAEVPAIWRERDQIAIWGPAGQRRRSRAQHPGFLAAGDWHHVDAFLRRV